MAFYAPTVNAYKRFQAGSFAPTRLAWSRDNRTAGFRVVGDGPCLRIECRIPGADCNPYLVYAAAIASGLDGIAQPHRAAGGLRGGCLRGGGAPRTSRDRSGRRSSCSTGASSPGGASGTRWSSTTPTSSGPSSRTSTRSVTDWERARYFERI